ENLVEAMGGRFPETWYFMSTHYEWDSHRINRGLPDEWPLDRHDWSLTYWTVLFDWTTAQPITGWSMFEFTRGYAGILIAPNYYGVLSGLYPSLMFTQEEKLWDNICFYIWLGDMEMAPPYVDDMYPDDGRRDVPLDTQIVFHCMDDEDEGAGIDVSTILFSVEASESRSEKALEVRDDRGAAIKQQYAPSYEITGTLEIDDDHLQDVVCTFTPDEDLPVAEIVCTVDETLADRIGLEMGYDEVWTFYTEGYEKVEEMSWGAIKALY
ncbi:hypothetical protein KAU45_00920, partial [bacterium]|nr:hypothetical protein [bacterium]